VLRISYWILPSAQNDKRVFIRRSPAKRDEEAIQLDRDECGSLGGHGALRAPRDDEANGITTPGPSATERGRRRELRIAGGRKEREK